MFKLIPEQYQLLARVVLVVALLALAATAGAMVNGWRLDAAHQRALTAKQAEYDALLDKVREQNRAVEALQAQSDAAEERRKMAEAFAADAIKRAKNREDAVANSKATTCDGVLREAWGVWK
jgi:beta-glucosidase-like glycosyl hydrolase